MSDHNRYMLRCLELAKNGLGTTYPNPMVGSVIVHQDQIIGEGWHQKAGGPHAEVKAIQAVKDLSLLAHSTLFVNLEPCSHFGKTPPCSDLIISHKIPHVVIGTVDPNEKVAGKGIEKLKAAGIQVTVGVQQQACNRLNQRFFTFHNQKRPYIILKWAQSVDGYIAPPTRSAQAPMWLSNVFSRQLVHKWRSEEQAILVGTQTVMDDNPRLDVRDWTGDNPVRVVIDRTGRTGQHLEVHQGGIPTIFITEQQNLNPTDRHIFENVIFDERLPHRILEVLYHNALQSVIIEGGRQTLQLFIDAGLWDQARVFVAPVFLKEGLKAPQIEAAPVQQQSIAGDELLTYFNHDQSHNF